MEIKICGLTSLEDISYVNQASVDYAGFVFFPPSKRNLTTSQALDLMAKLEPSIKKVAVMVSPTREDIIDKQEAGFDILQIHGQLHMDAIEAADRPVWLAVNIEDESQLEATAKMVDALPDEQATKIQAILVDAKDFGSGQTFNWRKSKRLLKAGQNSPPSQSELEDRLFYNKKFILAGGLNPNNVSQGIELFQPDIVDVSSGVEIAKDIAGKDEAKIQAFVAAVKNTGVNYE